MNNTVIQLKIKQRLNKLASSDYDNIEQNPERNINTSIVYSFDKITLPKYDPFV